MTDIDLQLPTIVNPVILKVLPIRANCLKLILDPTFIKLNTDKSFPLLIAIDRKLIEEESLKKSETDTRSPARALVLMLNVLPIVTNFNADILEPDLANDLNDRDEPSLQKSVTLSE
jgi:hypothetical protein